MEKTSFGKTTLTHIPEEILSPKRKTNRSLTLIAIAIIAIACWMFWNYQQRSRAEILVIPPDAPAPRVEQTTSITDIQAELSSTEIPDFHESL